MAGKSDSGYFFFLWTITFCICLATPHITVMFVCMAGSSRLVDCWPVLDPKMGNGLSVFSKFTATRYRIGRQKPIYRNLSITISYLLIYLSRHLDQETAKWPFRSSSRSTTCCYQSKQQPRLGGVREGMV